MAKDAPKKTAGSIQGTADLADGIRLEGCAVASAAAVAVKLKLETLGQLINRCNCW